MPDGSGVQWVRSLREGGVTTPVLIMTALANLLDNAWRHGAQTCWITVQTQGAQQSLSLRDDGQGVDAQRLATPQAAVDQTADDPTAGLGLGLKLAALALEPTPSDPPQKS